MADTALEIVSLDVIKTELRLGGDTVESRAAFVDHDLLLTGHIQAAVGFVEDRVRLVLIDRTKTFSCPRPTKDDSPLCITSYGIKSIDAVRYWTGDDSLRDDPTGSIALATLGREGYYGSKVYYVWPPEDGWPKILENSALEIDSTLGLDSDGVPESLRQAVVVMVRQLYDGYREMRPTDAFFSLVRFWRRY